LEGLEISEVKLSELEYSGRLDSEYYRPVFLLYEKVVKTQKSVPLSEVSDFLIGPFGSAFTVENYTDDKSYRYIRGKDVKQMKIMDDDDVYLPKADFDRLSKYALKENDLLVSVVGTLGNAALIQKENIPAIFSCKNTVLRVKEISAPYLLTYINSKYGRSLLLRKERGAIQKGLNLDDLKTLDIFVAGNELQLLVEHVFKSSVEIEKKAKSTYTQAENLLLTALGISDFSPSTKNTSEKTFKNSFLATGRLDAEYYQPKFDELEAEIAKSNELAQLIDFLTLNQRGTQPNYAEQGLPVINSKHVREGEVLLTDNRFATLSEKEEPLVIQKGDVLINGTGVGTIGRSACYLHEQNALPDNHVTILRTDKINPIFLSVYLNSIAGKYQVDKYFKGSSGQIELYPKDIENFYIPIISAGTQTQIADLVQQSFALKAESERLLAAAKRAVEIAIEENEDVAMAYLNKESHHVD